MSSTNRASLCLVALFIVAKLLAPYLLVSPLYDLHRDEYLHLDQADHLAWGYLSVPPLSSWVALLIKGLGGGIFWVRFFPALFGALTLWTTVAIVKELGGKLYAQTIAATAILFSVILRVNILFQPNSFDILCWTAVYYFATRFVKSRSYRWLYACGIAVGVGWLNKYNIAFLVAGLTPALLLTQPSLLQNKHLYGAAAVCLLVMLPNVWWQYSNGWPVFHHMQLLTKTQLDNGSRRQFLLEQVLFFIGSLFLLIASFFGFVRWKELRPYRFVAISFALSLLIFLYMKAKGYYAIGLYPVLIAYGAAYLEKVLSRLAFGKWLRPLSYLVIIGLFVPPLYAIFPILTPPQIAERSEDLKVFGVLRWEDGKDHQLPQDFADMLGWKEMGQKTAAVYDSLPDKATTLVLCNNYGQAGAVNYYGAGKGWKAMAFDADYLSWFPALPRITTVIRLKESDDPVSAEERQLFGEIRQAGIVENAYAREKGTAIYVMTKPKMDIAKLIREEAAMEKGEWRSDKP